VPYEQRLPLVSAEISTDDVIIRGIGNFTRRFKARRFLVYACDGKMKFCLLGSIAVNTEAKKSTDCKENTKSAT